MRARPAMLSAPILAILLTFASATPAAADTAEAI